MKFIVQLSTRNKEKHIEDMDFMIINYEIDTSNSIADEKYLWEVAVKIALNHFYKNHWLNEKYNDLSLEEFDKLSVIDKKISYLYDIGCIVDYTVYPKLKNIYIDEVKL